MTPHDFWLKQAEEDLITAESMIEKKRYYASAFFSQQAAEKALKASILKKKREEKTTHSLVYLGKEADIPQKFMEPLRRLSPQYFLARYPDASDELPIDLYSEQSAQEFLTTAREVIAWVNK